MSHRPFNYLLAFSLVAAPAVTTFAQDAYVAAANPSYTQEPAPIERGGTPQDGRSPYDAPPDGIHGVNHPMHHEHLHTAQPARGVNVRSDAPLQTVASDAQHVELKLDHGRANVMVHDPAQDQLVLVDLPGGQTQLLKNGFYTFNADTNTVRVFSGEADAFGGTHEKPAHLKGDDQAVFTGGNAKVSYSDPYESRQDVLQGPNGYGNGYEARGDGFAEGGFGDGGGYAVVPYGYYGGPYGGFGYADGWADYAYDYPYYGYGWGYPYGWGYGIGFGWVGGYRGWGYGGRGYGYGGGRGGPIHPGGYGGGGFRGGSVGGGFHGGGGGHR